MQWNSEQQFAEEEWIDVVVDDIKADKEKDIAF